MTFYLPNPENRTHRQTNRNDVSGTIYVSKNIDLDEEAYIKLSEGVAAVMTEDDDEDFDNIDAMNIGDGDLYVNAGEVFKGEIDNSSLSNRSSDSNAPSPNSEDDVIYFNNTQVVSDGTTVKYLSGSTTWTTISGLTISGNAPTVLELNDGQNGLMIGHGNVVDLINTSWSLVRTLTLPNEYKVSSMASNGSLSYVGTRHDASGEARLFIWDGNSTSASESYGIENFEIASVKAHGSSVVCFSADGRMLRFNGGGFGEIANLPVYMTPYQYGDEGNDYSTLSNRGMISEGNQVFAIPTSIVSPDTINYLSNQPGGVWCFDPVSGFYHRHSPSLTTIQAETIADSAVDIPNNQITVSSAPITGTPVLFEADSEFIGGLKELYFYYVIQIDSTTIQLAESYSDAINSVAVSLTSTGSSSQKLFFYNTFDYGHSYLDDRSSIAALGNRMRDERYAGRFAFGSDLRNEALVPKVALNTPVPGLYNRGYFITPRMYSTARTDKYGMVNFKHAPLDVDDEIVLKYRTTTRTGLPIDLTKFTGNTLDAKGTWVDTDTFTTTQDLSKAQKGDEVEIIGGKGAGFLAHIESLSESSDVWTVNLTESFIFAQAADEFLYIVDNWQYATKFNANSENSSYRLDVEGEFLQLKVELRGVRTKIIDIMIDNKSYRQLV